jgi:small subunit ribosomal protein S13
MKKLVAKNKILNKKIKKTVGLNEFSVKKAFKKFGVNLRIKISFLKRKHKASLNKSWLLLKTNNSLKKQTKQCVAFFIKIKHFKGFRHKFKYPCRGQRTRTNAKTRKKNQY